MMDAFSLTTSEVMVTICCITYNHEPYIRQCLDGFVMQKTNFRFEALVHDDASTDGTADIIREYAAKYPDIIKPIYQTENQYQKKVGILKTFLFPRATGKYIAMCEGDDYWTDPLKLQKQVDFLNNNLETVLCSHLFVNLKGEAYSNNINWEWADKRFDLCDLIKGEWPLQTATIMFRKECLDLDLADKFRRLTETVIVYLLLKRGSGYVLSDKMSVYRESSQGVWSGLEICDQWAMVANVRLDIYKVERSFDAASLVLQSTQICIGRYTYIKHFTTTMNIILIMVRYRGLSYTLRWLILKFVLGKDSNN